MKCKYCVCDESLGLVLDFITFIDKQVTLIGGRKGYSKFLQSIAYQ